MKLSLNPLQWSDLKKLLQLNNLELADDCKQRISNCYQYLQKKLANNEKAIYGINTGFGSLCNTSISSADLSQLQYNLMRSHACGTGAEVPQEIVRIMLLLKVLGLSKGHSGVQLQTVQRLLDFYNQGIYPVVFQQGSLGASGDLAPLAHLCLPLIGEGEVYYQNERMSAAQVLKLKNWEPLTLDAKEGLALLNGTQFMLSYGVYLILQAEKWFAHAMTIAALSLDAYDGRLDPFSPLLHNIRPHQGQIETAKKMLELLQDSEMSKQTKIAVQDPYSFRCIPQVHGASYDSIRYVASVLLTEVNAVSDNPNIFPEEDLILSGGNFHGQPLALVLDFLSIALAELGSISERRTYLLISGTRGLPPFLAHNPGLESGYMIVQYTAASIVSQNKQYCSPASVDSIPSSNGQEDHVSMGANAATKAYHVFQNTAQILALEWLTAVKAYEFRTISTSSVLKKHIHTFREIIPSENQDSYLHPQMIQSKNYWMNQENDWLFL